MTMRSTRLLGTVFARYDDGRAEPFLVDSRGDLLQFAGCDTLQGAPFFSEAPFTMIILNDRQCVDLIRIIDAWMHKMKDEHRDLLLQWREAADVAANAPFTFLKIQADPT